MREDEGLADLCKREYPRLVGALTLWCGERAIAEELAQEAFARAHLHWQRVKTFDQPAAWIRRIALNLATSSLRRHKAERRAYERMAAQAGFAGSWPDVDEAVMVRSAVGRLPALQRSVIILRFYLDVPVHEVAETLQRSPTAITSLTNRAVSALRADLGGTIEQPDEEGAG